MCLSVFIWLISVKVSVILHVHCIKYFNWENLKRKGWTRKVNDFILFPFQTKAFIWPSEHIPFLSTTWFVNANLVCYFNIFKIKSKKKKRKPCDKLYLTWLLQTPLNIFFISVAKLYYYITIFKQSFKENLTLLYIKKIYVQFLRFKGTILYIFTWKALPNLP